MLWIESPSACYNDHIAIRLADIGREKNMEENPLREDRILEIACLAGRILLENGAEVYRVEETVNRICSAYALAECQCFATPTALIVSAYDEEGKPHTLMRRVAVRDVDLAKINRVNGVSRRMGEGALALAEAKDALLAVEDTPHFPRWLELIAAGTGIGCFALLFGGGLPEALCAALGAALLQLFMVALRPVALPNILRRFLGGFLATVLSRLALLFFPAAS